MISLNLVYLFSTQYHSEMLENISPDFAKRANIMADERKIGAQWKWCKCLAQARTPGYSGDVFTIVRWLNKPECRFRNFTEWKQLFANRCCRKYGGRHPATTSVSCTSDRATRSGCAYICGAMLDHPVISYRLKYPGVLTAEAPRLEIFW